MENVVREGLMSAILQLWPLIVLGIAISLAKPLLIKSKKRRRRKDKKVNRPNIAVNESSEKPEKQGPIVGDAIKSAEQDFYNFYKKETASPSPKKDRNYSEDLMDQGDAYVARTHLMSPTERNVYKSLEKGYGEKYYIFCQVRVVDLIQPNLKKHHSNSREYLSLFRQLSQWHFDYVLCDKEDFRILCALELDDPSHERDDRVKRDRILNQACKAAGVKLERMKLNHKEKKVELVK